MGKPTVVFNRSDTNRAVQPQVTARSLKFRIYEEEGLYYLCSENKGADQLRSITAKLICAFVFAYADCWFSHETAHEMHFVCFLQQAMMWLEYSISTEHRSFPPLVNIPLSIEGFSVTPLVTSAFKYQFVIPSLHLGTFCYQLITS